MKRFGKRSAIFLLFFTLITGMLAGPWQPTAQAASSYHARVTVSTARVHTGPSGRYHTVAKLHRNATVTVIGTRGSWKKISYGGKTRYIYAKYIKKSTPSYSFRSYTNYVKSYSLVMRSKASSHYRKIHSLYMNYKVTVIGVKGSYRYVQYGSRKGYVQAKWLKSKVTSYSAYVVPGSINLWKGPGKKYGHLRYLRQNYKVTVTGSSNGYLKVNYNGTKGYAWGSYFKKGTPPQATAAAPAPAPTPVQQLNYTPVSTYPAYIGFDKINIYLDPNYSSTVVATLRERTAVSVIGINGNWVKIQFKDSNGNDKSGFIDNTPDPKHNNETNLITDFSKLNPPSGSQGVDISDNNGNVDFSALKQNNSFVVIKASEGNYKTTNDDIFNSEAHAAIKAGLKVDAYHYFTASTTDDAVNEAKHFAKVLSDAGFTNGNGLGYLFVDVEQTNGIQADSQNSVADKLSDNVNAFLNEMRSEGFNKLGVYTYLSFFNNDIKMSRLNQPTDKPRLLLWLARSRGQDTINGIGTNFNVDIWQYTSNGSVNGINGAVDLDVSYYDPNNM